MLIIRRIKAAQVFLASRPRLRFLLIVASLYATWVLGYEQALGPDGRLDHTLSVNIAYTAAALLRGAGFEAALAPQATLPPTVTMHGQPAVLVGAPCNGLALYALFAGFVLAYPGSHRRKGRFILLGIGVIYLLNVVRVAVLALNHTYWYHTVDFNHHYTFTFVVYAVIFGLWQLWARQDAVKNLPYASVR